MNLDSRPPPRIAVAFEYSPLSYYAIARRMDVLILPSSKPMLHAEGERLGPEVASTHHKSDQENHVG
jgi:hypothetical protein